MVLVSFFREMDISDKVVLMRGRIGEKQENQSMQVSPA